MKYLIIFFLILFLSLFQAAILPLNFLLVFVIILSLRQKAPISFVWAFLAGLFLDLFLFNPLGISALFFLSLDFILKLYRQRFSLNHPLVLSFVILISYSLYSFLLGKEIKILEAGLLLLTILLLRFFLEKTFLFTSPEKGDKLKL